MKRLATMLTAAALVVGGALPAMATDDGNPGPNPVHAEADEAGNPLPDDTGPGTPGGDPLPDNPPGDPGGPGGDPVNPGPNPGGGGPGIGPGPNPSGDPGVGPAEVVSFPVQIVVDSPSRVVPTTGRYFPV